MPLWRVPQFRARTGSQAIVHAFYNEQYDDVDRPFEEGNTNSPELLRRLDAALLDAFLPRWYRAEYETMRAWSAGENAEEHMERAKDAIEDIREVLPAEDRDNQYIEDRPAPLNEMVEAVESDLAEVGNE